MDLDTLEDYEESEREEAEKIFRKIQEKEIKEFSLLDFFPQVKKQIQGRVYTNTILHTNEWGSLSMQLPFYEKVLVPILSFRASHLFRKYYGISIEEMLHLMDKGKVVLLLFNRPINYAKAEENDYDMMLERRVPCFSIRWAKFIELSAERRGMGSMNVIGPKLFRDVGTSLKGLKPSKELTKWWRNRQDEHLGRRVQIRSKIKAFFWILHTYGYEDLARNLLNSKNFDQIFLGFWTYGTVFTIHQLSLGGIQSFSKYYFNFAKRMGLPITSADIFPFDVGKLLISECKLIDVRDLGFRKIIDICEQTGKARQALFELHDAVQTKQTEKAMDRAQSLKEVWEETNETIQSMTIWKERLEKTIPVMLGVTGGVLGGMSGLPGMIAGILGGGVGSIPIAEPVAEALVSMGKASHVATIFDLTPQR